MEKDTMEKAFALLHRLGITANYDGYFYTAYAIALAGEQPERLLLVTKWLYPDVAKQYGTTWKCVERNIRTVINLAWTRNPNLLSQWAGYQMDKSPNTGQFLAILAYYMGENKAA